MGQTLFLEQFLLTQIKHKPACGKKNQQIL